MDIYLLIDGQQQGPYTEDQVRQSLVENLIPADLPAWKEGLGAWASISDLLAPQVPPQLKKIQNQGIIPRWFWVTCVLFIMLYESLTMIRLVGFFNLAMDKDNVAQMSTATYQANEDWSNFFRVIGGDVNTDIEEKEKYDAAYASINDDKTFLSTIYVFRFLPTMVMGIAMILLGNRTLKLKSISEKEGKAIATNVVSDPTVIILGTLSIGLSLLAWGLSLTNMLGLREVIYLFTTPVTIMAIVRAYYLTGKQLASLP